MPEPPKITTSLADRIARLNANQKSLDRNQTTSKKEIGEIKSKINKYEATGQFEAPLIPKGSFGLGAPLTKPERGLDRIRIASSGVSGGMTVSNSIKSASPNHPFRSVSLGRSSNSNRPSSVSPDLGTPPTNPITTPPSSAIHSHSSSRSPVQTNSPSPSIVNRPTTPQEELPPTSSDQVQDPSGDSSQVYDGILEGYPTTPAAEDGPPMVTCSNCLISVELESLADHVCQLSVNQSNADHGSSSMDESREEEFPVDVPQSPIQEPEESSDAKQQPVITPSEEPQVTNNTPSKPVIKEEAEGPEEKKSIEINKKKEPVDTSKVKNRSSDASSHSTNTTNRLSGSNRPDFRGASPIYKNWHDDDDDDAYANSDGPTGFVTIVRSSSRI